MGREGVQNEKDEALQEFEKRLSETKTIPGDTISITFLVWNQDQPSKTDPLFCEECWLQVTFNGITDDGDICIDDDTISLMYYLGVSEIRNYRTGLVSQ